MVYYGWVAEGTAADPIYAVLRNALMRMPEVSPFRGPKEFKDGEFTYLNSWSGDIVRYSGEEQIMKDEKIIYKANYMGGLVDQSIGV